MSDYISRRAAISVLEERIYANRTVIPVVSELNRSIGYITRLPSADVRERSIDDCTGCKFVGTYETEFPCAVCERKTKDYYCRADMRGESE